MSKFSESQYVQKIKFIWDEVSIHNGPTKFLEDFSRVPRSLGIIWSANFCLSEVHNGGLLQFFFNNTGVLAPEALQGLRAIGMPCLAEVLGQAMDVLGNPYPREREDRWSILWSLASEPEKQIEADIANGVDKSVAFYRAMINPTLSTLTEKIFLLATEENGGFGLAADSYIAQLPIE